MVKDDPSATHGLLHPRQALVLHHLVIVVDPERPHVVHNPLEVVVDYLLHVLGIRQRWLVVPALAFPLAVLTSCLFGLCLVESII